MYVLGVDENGLGPRLGPMLTTGVLIEVGGTYQAAALARRGLARGITDSKATSSSQRMRFAESLALALLERVGDVPRAASALIHALHLDGPLGLVRPCPDAANRALCHARDLALPAFGGSVDEGRVALGPLLRGRSAIRIARVRCVVHCAGVLNHAKDAGRGKLALDLDAMQRLAIDARASVDEPIDAICGMIGGIRDVPRYSVVLPPESLVPRESERGVRAYDVDGLGHLSFEVDADARHLPVAMASLVGKYLRELAMHRIGEHLRAEDAELVTPSGYHDPITARFVAATEPLRRRLGIVDDCFERRG